MRHLRGGKQLPCDFQGILYEVLREIQTETNGCTVIEVFLSKGSKKESLLD